MNGTNTPAPPPGFVATTADPGTPTEPTTVTEYAIRYNRPDPDGGYTLVGYGNDEDFARRELAALWVPTGRSAYLVARTITVTPWAPVEA